MDLGLRGKRAVVTGASRGIGRAIAFGLADEGADVSICARGIEALDETAREIAARGVRVHAAACDVGDPEALGGFLDDGRAALGGVDILVNNASGFGGGNDDESWRVGFSVDVMAAVRASRQVAGWMEAAGGGCIVHLASTAALEAGAPPAYSAAKAALISFSKNQALTLVPRRIRVNCVAPGSIDFPGGVWDRIRTTSPAQYEAIRSTIPFGRLGTPEEVAAAVVFLASPRAGWVAGVCLPVDGVQHKGNL